MNIFQAVYKAQLSVLAAATRTYLTAVITIAQTLIVEVAETTVQAGYDRADWFYGVWAEAHYSKMPETQPVEELEPDYWFEPLEVVTLNFEPLHRLIAAPAHFTPFDLLPPAPVQFVGMTIRELRANAKERGIKKYGSLPKA
jgi:hypothetical protein